MKTLVSGILWILHRKDAPKSIERNEITFVGCCLNDAERAELRESYAKHGTTVVFA